MDEGSKIGNFISYYLIPICFGFFSIYLGWKIRIFQIVWLGITEGILPNGVSSLWFRIFVASNVIFSFFFINLQFIQPLVFGRKVTVENWKNSVKKEVEIASVLTVTSYFSACITFYPVYGLFFSPFYMAIVGLGIFTILSFC